MEEKKLKIMDFFLNFLGIANLAVFIYLLVKEIEIYSMYFMICLVLSIVQFIYAKTNSRIKNKQSKSMKFTERLQNSFIALILMIVFSPFYAPAGLWNLAGTIKYFVNRKK